MDPIEKNLSDIALRLQTAWRNSQCLICPLGELAALAAATLTFYQESQRAKQANERDHWTRYRKP